MLTSKKAHRSPTKINISLKFCVKKKCYSIVNYIVNFRTKTWMTEDQKDWRIYYYSTARKSESGRPWTARHDDIIDAVADLVQPGGQISRLSAYVRVNGGYLGHKFWTYDLLLYFVRFINTCFHKLDRYKYAQSANIAWNVLLLCLRLLHGTVATKRMCGRKFLHQVLWHSLAKLWTKNYKIPSISVKITAKKQWHFFYVHTVYMEIIVEIIDESINRCISTVHNLLYKNKSVQLCITRWREICITRSTAATFEN